jgi:hypothetical protein
METGAGNGRRHSMISDTELLRRIGHDLRSLYAEVIQQPIPPKIKAALARIDREQSRSEYQTQRIAL